MKQSHLIYQFIIWVYACVLCIYQKW
jgi:hypothetical protein